MKALTPILLLALLTASPAWGGMAAKRMMAVMPTCKAQTGTVNAVNGVTFIAPGEADDTGVGTPSALPLCSGTVTVSASCSGGTGNAHVSLEINGVVVRSLDCATGENRNDILSWPVSGRYTVMVSGTQAGSGIFNAGVSSPYFSFPVAQ